MPQLSMSVPHQLQQSEALRRLKEKAAAVGDAYQAKVPDLKQEWNDNCLTFGLSVMGMKIQGAVTVEADAVKMSADLPFMAMAFRGMIEQRVREELAPLLA